MDTFQHNVMDLDAPLEVGESVEGFTMLYTAAGDPVAKIVDESGSKRCQDVMLTAEAICKAVNQTYDLCPHEDVAEEHRCVDNGTGHGHPAGPSPPEYEPVMVCMDCGKELSPREYREHRAKQRRSEPKETFEPMDTLPF